ncbi:MAG: PDZ domain-containing protein, partial [Gemmatimonadota bacterium]
IPVESAVFGVTPYDNYTVYLIFPEGFGGGTALEHQSSNVGVYATGLIGTPAIPNIVAHEMFHAWNVKRLRPAEMVPYRYSSAQPTTLLWVSEGFTDYYADLAEVRGGAIDSTGFAENTLNQILSVANSPAISVDENSLSVWVHPIDGTFFLYYDKGALIGLLLDIMIRDASDNHGSLDTVMRSLYHSTYLKGLGFTQTDFWTAVSRAAGGRSFRDFRRRYVAGQEPLPIDSVLALAGMRHVTLKSRVPRLGIGTRADSSGVIVTQLVPSGPYAQAGGLLGDTIVTLGGRRVSDDPDFTAFRREWAGHEGESFPVEIRRGGLRQTLSVKVVLIDRNDDRLEYDAAATGKPLAIRNRLLHGDGPH